MTLIYFFYNEVNFGLSLLESEEEHVVVVSGIQFKFDGLLNDIINALNGPPPGLRWVPGCQEEITRLAWR